MIRESRLLFAAGYSPKDFITKDFYGFVRFQIILKMGADIRCSLLQRAKLGRRHIQLEKPRSSCDGPASSQNGVMPLFRASG